MRLTHFLKIQYKYFEAVRDGLKTFEIRKNDRNFKVGDHVVLKQLTENSNFNTEYTGYSLEFEIGYICDYAQKENYVVFSLIPAGREI
jgi:hypothetical protein